MPRLSIIICAYNESAYIAEQLRAIASQIRNTPYESQVEIVFVDDAAKDTTFDIAVAFQKSLLPSMRILRMPNNVGCAIATNYGAQMAHGDYFYIASANDIMQPRAILSIFEAIDAFPSVDMIVGDVAGIHLGWGANQNGETISPRYIPADQIVSWFGPQGIIHAAGCVISRRAWDQHGGWDASFWPYSETLTWHTVACRYGAVYTPNAFGWVRQHPGSASTTVLDREWRRPLMERAAQFVMTLEEPARSRLISSRLWDITEWSPDMRSLLNTEAIVHISGGDSSFPAHIYRYTFDPEVATYGQRRVIPK